MYKQAKFIVYCLWWVKLYKCVYFFVFYTYHNYIRDEISLHGFTFAPTLLNLCIYTYMNVNKKHTHTFA